MEHASNDTSCTSVRCPCTCGRIRSPGGTSARGRFAATKTTTASVSVRRPSRSFRPRPTPRTPGIASRERRVAPLIVRAMDVLLREVGQDARLDPCPLAQQIVRLGVDHWAVETLVEGALHQSDILVSQRRLFAHQKRWVLGAVLNAFRWLGETEN